MNARTAITPHGIDRVLRQAGHPRYDARSRWNGSSQGYAADHGELYATSGVVVTWEGSLNADRRGEREALAPIADTLMHAGYAVRHSELYAPHEEDSEEFHWPCLIVTVKDGQP